MRCLTLLIVLSAVVLLAGCEVFSVHPLYTENDVVTVPGIEGTWFSDGKQAARVQRSGENSYLLFLFNNESKHPMQFQARFVRIGTHLFLDFERPKEDFYIPAHGIYRIALDGDVLRYTGFRDSWAEKNIPETFRWDTVLTLPTAKLQELVAQHAENAEAFDDPEELFHERIESKLKRAQGKATAIALDRDCRIAGDKLTAGSYRFIPLDGEYSRSQLYFFAAGKKATLKTIEAVASVEITAPRSAGDSSPVSYVEDGGQLRISAIRTATRTYLVR